MFLSESVYFKYKRIKAKIPNKFINNKSEIYDDDIAFYLVYLTNKI